MSEDNTVETALKAVEKIMMALGAKKMDYYTNPFHYRDVFEYHSSFFRCGIISFSDKPYIVIECAESLNEVNNGCMPLFLLPEQRILCKRLRIR